MDNPETVTKLLFRQENPAGAGIIFLIGKSEDKKVVRKAMGMTRGLLVNSAGHPIFFITDLIAFIRVK
jgi:hypothetical protein